MIRLSSHQTYLLNKILRYSIAIILILSINFLMPRMMPGDPVYTLLSDHRGAHADQTMIDNLRAEYGLDRPLLEQYINYLVSLSQYDLGYSMLKGEKVSDLILGKLFWTIYLLLPSITIGQLLALLLGTLAGFNSGRKIDIVLTSACVLANTIPAFLVAMVFISVFSFHLSWFPLSHFSSGNVEGMSYIMDTLWHMALPMIVLIMMELAYTFIVVRNSIVQINEEYFIFVARSKGLSEPAIAFKHVMRNVLPPFISISALGFSYIVSGALIIEIVFSLQGMGTLIYDAVLTRDYPLMQGAFLVIMISVVVMNFIAEVLYGIVDPRLEDSDLKTNAS